jgi:hypothetical protein
MRKHTGRNNNLRIKEKDSSKKHGKKKEHPYVRITYLGLWVP